MYTVNKPEEMNEIFARAYNSGRLENLLGLYEEDAVLVDAANETASGKQQIATKLQNFMNVPGTLVGRNNFCLLHGDLALLRADWTMLGEDGSKQLSGSSAEIVRRQANGAWLYVIDHAVGASIPRPVDQRR